MKRFGKKIYHHFVILFSLKISNLLLMYKKYGAVHYKWNIHYTHLTLINIPVDMLTLLLQRPMPKVLIVETLLLLSVHSRECDWVLLISASEKGNVLVLVQEN